MMTAAGIAAAIVILVLMAVLWRQYILQEKAKKEREEKSGRIRAAQLRMGKSRIIRKHLIFDGLVQGVGFRYQARYAADKLDVTGWVENLPDGRVVMEAQGRPEDIERVLAALRSGRWIRIESVQEETIPCVESEYGFRVKGY